MADTKYIRASDGTGNAEVATVQTTRAPLSTTLIVDTVEGMPTKIMGSMGTPHTFVDPVSSETITVISEATAVDFSGHIDGSNIEIDAIAPGYTDLGSEVGDIIIIRPTTPWADNIADLMEVAHNDDGTLKDGAVDTSVIADDSVTAAKLSDELKNGWNTGLLPAISGSPTSNGNRSYTLPFASDVSALLYPKMKVRVTRTVAASTYMAGLFNGSSHYFTKLTCTGSLSTVSNNFTIYLAGVRPTSYVQSVPLGRSDAGINNSLYMQILADGTVRIGISNGGSGNTRAITSRESIRKDRDTNIAITWASGTVLIYFNGNSVAVGTAITAGTAPTTAGTGGDFSIGRLGASASNYFAGYLSGAAVFDAVLSASTIKAMQGQPLTGAETNCIGAWSLNNTGVNQQAPGTNDLTATGGVGYTSGKSPYGNNGASSTLEYASVMAVSGSNATVQVPEGCAIPTSGGISAVDYSTEDSPFGWPSEKERWEVAMLLGSSTAASGSTINTWYNPGGINLNIPIGNWELSGTVQVFHSPTSTVIQSYCALSTSASSYSDPELTSCHFNTQFAANPGEIYAHEFEKSISLSAATPYYIIVLSAVTLSSAMSVRSAPSATTSPELTKVIAVPSGI